MDIALSRHAPNRLGTLHAPDEVERAVAHRLGPHRMAARGLDPFHAELYEVPLHHGALLELCYGRETRIDFGGDAEHFLFRLTLAGACELQAGSVVARAGPGELTVSSPALASRLSTSPDCRNLVLRLERGALERKLQDMLQATLTQPLHFDLAAGGAGAGAALLLPTFEYLCRLGAQPGIGTAATTFGADLTTWLMSLLLTHLPHSYSDALTRGTPPLPAHVRRACDHVDAHLGEPLALAALAAVAGVAPRTLQHAFRAFLHTTPAAYVRDRRLAAVHAALQRGDARSVTDVLIAHGIHGFGHFAKAYARRYGHAPSVTARQPR
ncbi:AraC family transcriptional regulator [Burkholderia contaminans FFH2055]|uniref:AraC family transcriptional regulator n=1 Tax=Burkholderia contaminans TaxID=488447 RepID=UPI000625EC0D|nr:AraC family transcriptional regulator [Burkholderia contaminans]KKL31445.1 AraC family transcriptional regulator [Burkholderia contaminans FFH2055]MEB4632814.1 AraC family transcriptional regulator [Burkholderia contaminans]MEB4640423.1 AraC family transcriptional regulator [Burkholderia contaminans]MEB4655415.1 AraC family transcriptional regulator [Burkholderia contaminans]MEB4663717.1 AraC family transcriptional regulator [Burkholderia contaminans]